MDGYIINNHNIQITLPVQSSASQNDGGFQQILFDKISSAWLEELLPDQEKRYDSSTDESVLRAIPKKNEHIVPGGLEISTMTLASAYKIHRFNNLCKSVFLIKIWAEQPKILLFYYTYF